MSNRRIYFGYMKTVINIKTDKQVKEEAQKITQALGLPLSTVINAYLKQLVRTRAVYFSDLPQMTGELESLVAAARVDFKKKKDIVGPFATGKEMDDFLDSL